MKGPLRHVALLITIYFPPEPGGGSSHGWNRAMILHKMGYTVFVLCGFPTYPTGKLSNPKYKRKLFYLENVEPFVLIRIRLFSLAHRGYFRRLILFLTFVFLAIIYIPKILQITRKISVVYALAPILFSSIIGWVYSRMTRSFFVYEAADLWPEELVTVKSVVTPLIMRIGRVAAKISYAIPDMIVTVSDLAAETISSRYKPKSKVYSIPIGVDVSKFQKLSKENSRVELTNIKILPEYVVRSFIILYSGIISSAQQVENLVYAAERLKVDKDIAIVIIGDGEDKPKLLYLKSKHDLDNLYLLPFQPRHIIPSIISASDVCTVLLSPNPIYDIAVPTKFYEYLACGKPIVGVCRGELARLINSYRIGRTVDPGDIERLVEIVNELKNSPDLVRMMEDNCAIALEKFSLDNLASIFSDILKKEKVRRSA